MLLVLITHENEKDYNLSFFLFLIIISTKFVEFFSQVFCFFKVIFILFYCESLIIQDD